MEKNLVSGPFGPNLGRQHFFFFFFFKNLALSVTRYHGQLSWCTLSEKTNDPILRKISDGQTDKSDFLGRYPTNVERPIRNKAKQNKTKKHKRTFRDTFKKLRNFLEICNIYKVPD